MTFLSSSLPTETNKGLSNFDFQVELHVHIVLFFFFYSSILFCPVKEANNLQRPNRFRLESEYNRKKKKTKRNTQLKWLPIQLTGTKIKILSHFYILNQFFWYKWTENKKDVTKESLEPTKRRWYWSVLLKTALTYIPYYLPHLIWII